MKLKVYDCETYYDGGDRKPRVCNINPGYTCLVGPNGSGKTTLLKQIRGFCEENSDKYEVLHYDNLHNGGSRAAGSYINANNPMFAATLLSSSEGEGIMLNLGSFAQKCGKVTRICKEKDKSFVILVDGFDSGTSIDKIYEFRKYFVDTIIDHCASQGIEVYIIVTANNYEMTEYNADCIVAHTRSHKRFKTYNSFKKFIIQLADKLNAEMEE